MTSYNFDEIINRRGRFFFGATLDDPHGAGLGTQAIIFAFIRINDKWIHDYLQKIRDSDISTHYTMCMNEF